MHTSAAEGNAFQANRVADDWQAAPPSQVLSRLQSDIPDADEKVEPIEKKASTDHFPLVWIISKPQLQKGSKITARGRAVRSHIMLDYRRKRRLAESGLGGRPASKDIPLLPRQSSVMMSPGYNSEHSLSVERDNGELHDESLEAQELRNFNNFHLHMIDFSQKRPQLRYQSKTRSKIGPRTYQATISSENWAHVDRWSSFTVLGAPITSRMREHLHYFVNVVIASQHSVRSGFMIDLQEVWPTHAQSNPALLHALIATSTAFRIVREADVILHDPRHAVEGKYFGPSSIDFLFHQAEAIRQINGMLSDPSAALSDFTLGAVIFVIASDMILERLSRTHIHLNGLRQMVNLRGTIESLPFRLASLVRALDVKLALVCGTEPIYPLIRSVPQPYPVLFTDSDISIIGSRFLNLDGFPNIFHDEIISVIRHLCDLTKYTEMFTRKATEDICDEEFDDNQRIYLEHRILSLSLYYQRMGKNSVEGCCCLAILLFVNTVLWQGWSSSTTYIRTLITRLKHALEGTDLRAFWPSYQEMLIWILFLGANSSAGKAERTYFVSQLVAVTAPRSLKRWEDMRETMLGFFYLDSAHQHGLKIVWAEVQRAMASD